MRDTCDLGRHSPRRVVICEPQCHGFEHASFNAALVQTVVEAYPEADVAFWGEPGHVEAVRTSLAATRPQTVGLVDFVPIAVPAVYPRDGVHRLGAERVWVKRALRAVAARQCDLLVVASATRAGIMCCKWGLHTRRGQVPVLIVLHSLLQHLRGRWPRRPWHWPFDLRVLWRMPHPCNLRYVALGQTVWQGLAEISPRLRDRFVVLRPPYLWRAADARPLSAAPKPVRFGYLGIATESKGFSRFVSLAHDLNSEVAEGRCQFAVAGFVDRKGTVVPGDLDLLEGVAYSPLGDDEYAARVSSLTYVVGLGDPRVYQLAISASFLDSLAFIKPGIYLRTPFLEHCFAQMGDLGYLCDDYEQVSEVAAAIARDFPTERYCQQCGNIAQARTQFEPAAVAKELRRAVSSCLSATLTAR